MKERKQRGGFTLIELIVVIAVLAIIAALSIPAFNGLEEQSRKRVCLSNQITLTRAFAAEYNLHGGDGFDLESFLTDQGLTKEGTGYTGYCPSEGGVYTITLNSKEERLTIRCSIHGAGEGAYTALIGQNIAEMLNNALKSMLNVTTGFIDSEALNAEGNAAPKRAAVEAALKTLGFSTGEDTTWAINGNASSRRILWTEQKLTLVDYNKQVVAIRYDSANNGKGTYTVVTANVVRPSDRGTNDYPSNNYVVLDARDGESTPTEYTDANGTVVTQDDTSKASFEAAYAFYQSVLNSRARS